jgi:hypothetical protein
VRRLPVLGVVSGPKTYFGILCRLMTVRFSRMEGYEVDVLGAIEVLEMADPAAAEWWRHSTPHLLRRWRCFVFPASCCVPVEV